MEKDRPRITVWPSPEISTASMSSNAVKVKVIKKWPFANILVPHGWRDAHLKARVIAIIPQIQSHVHKLLGFKWPTPQF